MKIAIIGGGPSGSVSAALFAQNGHDVAMFDEGSRPEIISGESLVPGVIPIFRRLGIEDQIAAISVLKPGVTFIPKDGKKIEFRFSSLPKKFPPYAYNTPRPALDEILEKCALGFGATKIPKRAELLSRGDKIELAPPSLDSVPHWNGSQPDFVIDASGRSRVSSKLMNIKADIGPRRDVSHFAHFHGIHPEFPSGQVIINRLESGWSWRIPLPGKTSFGIVLDRLSASNLGDSPEARLDAVLKNDPLLKAETFEAKRISRVETYANYQLTSTRGVGANWACVGDAFGFVDPMLSPGILLALKSAELLHQRCQFNNLNESLKSYSAEMVTNLNAWRYLIDFFYSGRIFELYDQGLDFQRKFQNLPIGFIDAFMTTNLASMASGFTTASRFAQGILGFAERYMLENRAKISEYAIA